MYTYARILVAVDGSQVARRAFNAALNLASVTGAVLQPFSVVEHSGGSFHGAPGQDPALVYDQQVQQAQTLAAELEKLMRERGVKGALVTGEVATISNESIAQAIIQSAAEFGADVIVMGTHGRSGVKRLLLGSVAECCVRQATLPVLLIPSAAGQDGAAG